MSAAGEWTLLSDLLDAPPVATPAVVPISGNNTTDAASLLAAGGPGDPTLPGWNNVGRGSDGNTTVIYLGAGWCLTAAHVPTNNQVFFGGQSYAVEAGSVEQLHNSNGSLADLKLFRILDPPDLPYILPDLLAPEGPTGPVYMIGNGLSRGTAHFWRISTAVNPWVWTEQAPPAVPGPNDAAGFDVIGPRTMRWGQNEVYQTGLFVQVSGSTFVHGFTTRLDTQAYTGTPAYPHEAQASAGDSGGAVFTLVDGQWVLSGIMIAISGPLNGQPSGTMLYGNITLIADLASYRDEILSIVTPTVVGRHVFYNNSSFDGNTPGAGPSDDAAIAPDKVPYIAGSGPATYANATSYSRGINGIMVDIMGPGGTLTADDFTFRVGTNSDLGTWTTAPPPTTVLVREGAGEGGSDRIEIVWADGAIRNAWLQVIVEGNDDVGGFNTNSGLETSDVFYFGNRVADSGAGSDFVLITSAADEIDARLNIGFGATLLNRFDYDRNTLINAQDQILARQNIGFLIKIDLPLGGALPLATSAAEDALRASLAREASRARLEDRLERQAFVPRLRPTVTLQPADEAIRRRAWQEIASEDTFDSVLVDGEDGDREVSPFELPRRRR